MSFSWPWALLALLVIPLVFAAWRLTRRRRRRSVVRVTSIALVQAAMPGRSRWRRRIPTALLTLGLAVLAVGAARPQATVPVASPTGATVSRDRRAGYADDVIVVLTDGSNNRGIDPQTAAIQAAGRGVRVFTIGYGTDNPAPLACSSAQFGGFGGVGFGGFGGRPGGQGNPFDADYGALMQISRTTGGTFYRAQDADQLSRALAKLPAAFTIVRKHIDIASAFAAGGGLLIAAAVALSLWWNRTQRMPAPARIVDH